VVIPYNWILDPSIPSIVGVPLVALFNIITVLAVIDFVRGGA
jgi:hypothetical protein